MKKIITADGSVTFFSEKYGESYHHVSGALSEARKKFVEPCKIGELAAKGSISILDIGFGLGYNCGVAIDVIKDTNTDCRMNIITLEKDENIFNLICELKPEIKNYNIIKEVAKNKTYSKDKLHITLLIGDARQTIKSVKQRLDAVFLDPFSPKKNPELWTERFFSEIRKRMKKNAILATYSCARIVRQNLSNVGFKVLSGPCIGRRAPITIVLNI